MQIMLNGLRAMLASHPTKKRLVAHNLGFCWHARRVYNRAKAAGRVVVKQACEVCLKPSRYAHHSNYQRPLDVIFLCHSCHMHVHRG